MMNSRERVLAWGRAHRERNKWRFLQVAQSERRKQLCLRVAEGQERERERTNPVMRGRSWRWIL